MSTEQKSMFECRADAAVAAVLVKNRGMTPEQAVAAVRKKTRGYTITPEWREAFMEDEPNG